MTRPAFVLCADGSKRPINWTRIDRRYAELEAVEAEGAKRYWRALSAKRRAAVARATPAWADMTKIAAVYAEADAITAATGIQHHVDHFYPVQGRRVSGLHVHNNLRVLLAKANLSKGARMIED